MNYCALNTTVGQLVAERPERAAVFESFGIDYCCSGRHPLSEACALRHVDPREVLKGLIRLEDPAPPAREKGCSAVTLTEIIHHITDQHHVFLKDALPRLTYLINRVWDAHAQHHPELSDVAEQFAILRAEMEAHMMEEEQSVFPRCRALEQGAADAASGPSLQHYICSLEEEHQTTARAFQKLRELTNDYVAPVDGCPTYRVMLRSLAELEEDTRKHVHVESNVLFPRALALEAGLKSAARRTA